MTRWTLLLSLSSSFLFPFFGKKIDFTPPYRDCADKITGPVQRKYHWWRSEILDRRQQAACYWSWCWNRRFTPSFYPQLRDSMLSQTSETREKASSTAPHGGLERYGGAGMGWSYAPSSDVATRRLLRPGECGSRRRMGRLTECGRVEAAHLHSAALPSSIIRGPYSQICIKRRRRSRVGVVRVDATGVIPHHSTVWLEHAMGGVSALLHLITHYEATMIWT